MSGSGQESLELFLQEASDNLQYLREYSGLVQEPHSHPEDFERLYTAAHALCSASASQGFLLFSEVADKLAHIFQYTMNARLGPDTYGPLTEFLSDAISLLEFDLLQIASDGTETAPDVAAFKQRYSFAFPPAPAELAAQDAAEEALAGTGAAIDAEQSVDASLLPEDDEVPQEILEFFAPEAEDHLQTATNSLLALEANPSAEEINRLFRSMHTVKGSAAQVGLHRLAAVAHLVEDLLGRLRDGELQPSAEIVDASLEAVDVLRKFLHRSWENEAEMRGKVEPLLARIQRFAPAPVAESSPETEEAAAEYPGAAKSAEGEPATISSVDKPRDTAQKTASAAAKSVRISLDRLDRMMNAVGELVINRTRMVGRLSELAKLVEVLTFSKGRLSTKVAEFQDKHEFNRISTRLVPGSAPPQMDTLLGFSGLPNLSGPATDSHAGFSELEMDRYDDFNILARSLTEISADVTEVLGQLETFMHRVDSDIDEFTKLAHHMQDEITRARMVPIGNLHTRLTRTVRDAAKATDKPVELVFEGAETELDNNIIQQISDPLIHLVRNAVAHGIEEPEIRRLAGKPAQGRVTLRAYHRGNHIFIEVEDDGDGINYEKIRSKAVESGRVTFLQSEHLTERELREFLFQPGFSTASSKTELAGRGVGLDVVRANVHALNGEIDLRSEFGVGSVFTLKVPLTLIISQALFVRCGNSTFAFPLALVEEIRRIKPEEIEEVGGKLLTKVRGAVTEVVRLDNELALPAIEPVNGYFRMVIVKAAGRAVGIIVEDVLGKDEIVIKNLGEYLRRVKLFPGTTIAPDGSLILLIDLNRLTSPESAQRHVSVAAGGAARVFAPGSDAVAAGSIPTEAVDAVGNDKIIVVVDDSISVRKFVGRMLEKAGYRVKLAADGLEATEVIAQVGCHLVLTDIEMPRMNGYDLMSHLRQNPATRNIPVMVVTSRAGAKHRDRAMKEGALGFLTKPVQEDQLLENVERIIGGESGSEASPAMHLRQG